MVPVLIIVALVFGALFALRLTLAQRRQIARYAWPLAVTALCLLLVLRGGTWGAVIGAGVAGLVWLTALQPPAVRPAGAGMSAAEAAAVLGVSETASAAEIKAAFRAKMREAHPDKGGTNERAARLIAARNTLLRR